MLSESTPILCGAIPAFEMFMSAWERSTDRRLEMYAKLGLECTYKYYSHMDRTRAYIITMRKWVCLRASDDLANCHLQS